MSLSSPFLQPGRRGPSRRPRRRLFAALSCALALLLNVTPTRALAAVNPEEYTLKAAFLLNFAKFVEWPADAATPGVLRIGIVAPDEVYEIIESSLAGKSVGDRRLQIEHVSADQLEHGGALPQIIFVHQDAARFHPEAGNSQQQEILTAAENRPVLLVGESVDFAIKGGMIGFIRRGENWRFQVNLASAQRVGLKLSARLSGLAELVKNPTP